MPSSSAELDIVCISDLKVHDLPFFRCTIYMPSFSIFDKNKKFENTELNILECMQQRNIKIKKTKLPATDTNLIENATIIGV